MYMKSAMGREEWVWGFHVSFGSGYFWIGRHGVRLILHLEILWQLWVSYPYGGLFSVSSCFLHCLLVDPRAQRCSSPGRAHWVQKRAKLQVKSHIPFGKPGQLHHQFPAWFAFSHSDVKTFLGPPVQYSSAWTFRHNMEQRLKTSLKIIEKTYLKIQNQQ